MVAVQRGTTGGTFVSAPGASKVGFGLAALIHFHEATPQDFAEFRGAFESESACLAAQRATDAQVAELGEIVERLGSP
jgi:DNA-binding FadR family transcriptional regulator